MADSKRYKKTLRQILIKSSFHLLNHHCCLCKKKNSWINQFLPKNQILQQKKKRKEKKKKKRKYYYKKKNCYSFCIEYLTNHESIWRNFTKSYVDLICISGIWFRLFTINLKCVFFIIDCQNLRQAQRQF